MIDSKIVWDSRHIIDVLYRQHLNHHMQSAWCDVSSESIMGHASIERVHALLAVDEILAAAIRIFYTRRAGVDVDTIPYFVKDQKRIMDMFSWLENHAYVFSKDAKQFGLPEMALISLWDWVVFRQIMPLASYTHLSTCVQIHAERKTLQETVPKE